MALTEVSVLAVLAELAPAGADRILDVTQGSQPLVWLAGSERVSRKDGDRLAAIDALHREERILHRGWGFLAGRAEVDGKPRKIRVPLLTQPVHLERTLTGYRVAAAGDVEVTPLITDRELAASLENAPGLGSAGWLDVVGARAWLAAAAEATGLEFDAVTEPGGRLPADRLVLVAGAALFVARDVFGGGLRDSLRSWAGRDLTGTALAAVYGCAPDLPAVPAPGDPVLSPLPLSEAQAAVVARARTAPVTVVSGPPGNGKSHTVVAAALEVVLRGGSVLIATQSPHAAEVLAALMARYPGPAPVLFGDADRSGLAASLGAGADEGVGSRQLRADRQAVLHNLSRVRSARAAITTVLRAELLAAGLPSFEPLLAGLAADVPGAFDDDVDLDVAARLLGLPAGAFPSPASFPAHDSSGALPSTPFSTRDASDALPSTPFSARDVSGALPSTPFSARGASGGGADEDVAGAGGRRPGWWARRRAAGARKRALRLLGARPGVPMERVFEALAAACAQRAAARLAVTGGGDLDRLWAVVHEAEAALRASAGTSIRHAAHSAERWDGDARRAAAALATALRAGRNRRRELLARLEAPPLVRALPLWIGTVADVEDLLPAAPGLFDLVVIDEASHVDQIRAAPVLARARRALIVGDPRQLRFVSFVSDAGVSGVLERHGADDRLDVRRVSTFDLAAAAAPTTWLTEHFRSVPHLIGFSARRFYDGRIAAMTRTPAADEADAVDVVPVPGAVVSDGVNTAEVAAAVAAVEKLAAAGFRSIGVITPFRAQADACESALVAAFPVERIEELGLRVGTVHAFQGSEADAVVVSLGLVDGDAAGRRRFVTDPQLFNVMITRARRRLVVLNSLTAPDGLLGDYLRYAAGPPHPGPAPDAPAGWAARLAVELERLGVPVRPGYAVGSWRIDLCAGPASSPAGVLCGVHPDGPEAHLARQSALHRAGWRLIDAFPTRWDGDPRRAALEIAAVCSSG